MWCDDLWYDLISIPIDQSNLQSWLGSLAVLGLLTGLPMAALANLTYLSRRFRDMYCLNKLFLHSTARVVRHISTTCLVPVASDDSYRKFFATPSATALGRLTHIFRWPRWDIWRNYRDFSVICELRNFWGTGLLLSIKRGFSDRLVTMKLPCDQVRLSKWV